MNQADRDRKKVWKAEQKDSAREAFPLPDNMLEGLFDFVDLAVGKDDCDNTLRFTEEWLEANNLSRDPVVNWLESNGGFCDCEVIFNVREEWEENR